MRQRGAYLSDKRRDGLPIIVAVSARDYQYRPHWLDGQLVEHRGHRNDHPRFARWQMGRYLQMVSE